MSYHDIESVSRKPVGKSKGIVGVVMIGVAIFAAIIVYRLSNDEQSKVGFKSGETGANWSATSKTVWQDLTPLLLFVGFAGLIMGGGYLAGRGK